MMAKIILAGGQAQHRLTDLGKLPNLQEELEPIPEEGDQYISAEIMLSVRDTMTS